MLKRLRDLDEYKDKLLATVSHDLKTPTNGINGMVD
jgi:K+-sensing histidine kinase KdpD